MGQSICLAVGSAKMESNLKIQNSWVNQFVWPWRDQKLHLICKFKIHGSIDLFGSGQRKNGIKFENSKFMGQPICLAVARSKIASNLKIQNSWVNRFVWQWA